MPVGTSITSKKSDGGHDRSSDQKLSSKQQQPLMTSTSSTTDYQGNIQILLMMQSMAKF